MYLFGGRADNKFVNNMLIYDTVNLSWKEGNSVDAPEPRMFYGATLLLNQKILYLGK